MKRTYVKALMFAAMAALPAVSMFAATPDNPVTVCTATLSVGAGVLVPNSALGAFGYDPINDRIFVGGFTGTNQQIRRIDNVSGVQTATAIMGNTAWLMFGRDGDLTKGGGTPTPSGMLLNPVAVGATPAYSNMWIADGATRVTSGTGTTLIGYANLTRKIYRYNLSADSVGGDTAPGDARNEMTSLVTLADVQAVSGSTGTSDQIGSRQYAWSGDGQSLYAIDAVTNHGGLWKIPAAGGAPTRLYANDNLNTEPAVISSGGVDSIYFEQNVSLGSLGASGGIDKITHDGVTTSAVINVVSKAIMSDFLELGTETMTSASMCADADGNIYFNNTRNPGAALDRRGIYKLDTSGRLSKVVSLVERTAALGGTNSNTLRMQPRTTSFTGPGGSFTLSQILYAESGVNIIAGAYVFKTGDFNRDNTVDQTDIALFKTRLTPRLQAIPAANNEWGRYDLNGTNSIDWKDVKVLQQFYAFLNGDANIDQLVDSTDFNALLGGYGKLTSALWTEGDFDGDQKVTTTDFNVLAANFGGTPPPVPGATLGAVVPEPTTLSVIGLTGLMMLARRRNS